MAIVIDKPDCCDAANGSKEPRVTDAAHRTNVCSSEVGQKRDKTKGSFAKGLWYKIFQRFGRSYHE
jgi:hypothetical protein